MGDREMGIISKAIFISGYSYHSRIYLDSCDLSVEFEISAKCLDDAPTTEAEKEDISHIFHIDLLESIC